MRAALFVILLGGCVGPRIQVEVVHPAAVVLPDSIERIALVQLARVEGPSEVAAQAAVASVRDGLASSALLTATVVEVALPARPEPLTPAEVAAICGPVDADALLALEGLRLQDKLRTRGGEAVLGEEEASAVDIEWTAEREVDLWVHWRLYDPRQVTPVDELQRRQPRVRIQARGPNEDDAERRLGPPSVAHARAGSEAGADYAQRITARRLVVGRTLETGAAESLRSGNRMAQRGDWPGAEAAWRQATEHADPLIRAGAWSNLAVAAEVAGASTMAIAHLDRALAIEEESGRRRYRAQLAALAREGEVVEEPALQVPTSKTAPLAIPAGLTQ